MSFVFIFSCLSSVLWFVSKITGLLFWENRTKKKKWVASLLRLCLCGNSSSLCLAPRIVNCHLSHYFICFWSKKRTETSCQCDRFVFATWFLVRLFFLLLNLFKKCSKIFLSVYCFFILTSLNFSFNTICILNSETICILLTVSPITHSRVVINYLYSQIAL